MLIRKDKVINLCAALVVLVAQSGHAQFETFFTINYEIRFSTDADIIQSNSGRVKVGDGDPYSISFEPYKVYLRVYGVSKDQFRIYWSIFERTDNASSLQPDSTFHQVNPTPLTIDGTYGIPAEAKSNIAGNEIDLAIVVWKLGPVF